MTCCINSFAHLIPLRFNKSAEELLQQYAKNHVDYVSASCITGFTPLTIHRWCRRYGIHLTGVLRKPSGDPTNKIDLKTTVFNQSNFLYRKWPTSSLLKEVFCDKNTDHL